MSGEINKFPPVTYPFPVECANKLKELKISYSLYPPKTVRVMFQENYGKKHIFKDIESLSHAIVGIANSTQTNWVGEGDHIDLYTP